MTSILKVDTIQDQAGNNIINESSDTITIGASGDTITIPSGATLDVNGIDFPTTDGTAGQVLQTNGSGVLSFVSISSGGFTLLGTLTTTSGATQTLSSLTLTDYKFLFITINNVSSTSSTHLKCNNINITGDNGNATHSFWGTLIVDLSTSSFSNAFASDLNTSGLRENSGAVRAGNIGFTTATTSIQFSLTAGNFDSGTIKIYGAK